MKLTRIFGIVLGLHVGVIVLVMLQPGCQSGKQDLTLDANETSLVEPDPLNSFNEGVSSQDPVVPKSENEFVSPTRPKSGGIIVPGQVEPVVEPVLERPPTRLKSSKQFIRIDIVALLSKLQRILMI